MGTIKKQLGQRIKEIRKSKGLTQEKLAEIVGIGTSNISYIETGKFAPSIENFERIAEALDVEPHELYMFSSKSINEIKKELFNVLENDDEMLQLFYRMYKAMK